MNSQVTNFPCRSTFFRFLMLTMLLVVPNAAHALISGGKGNAPIRDAGWPAGAAKVFNWESRIAWWEGPPYGGGRWHAEATGDVDEINRVLEAFAKIESHSKRVILKDGTGYSFWLDPNRIRNKTPPNPKHKIDWEFTVWTTAGWDRQQRLPVDMRAANSDEPEAVVTIYIGTLDRQELRIPKQVIVTDQTLIGHGFTVKDGRVLTGVLMDAVNDRPIVGTICVQRIETKETGGYAYSDLMTLETDASGRWTTKNFPSHWCRLIAQAKNHSPRIIHHAMHDQQPGYTAVDAKLAPTGTVSGQVVDDQGKAIPDASIVVRSIDTGEGGRYEIPKKRFESDQNGRFSIADLPQGHCRLTAYKAGHEGGLGTETPIPNLSCKIVLSTAGEVRIAVDFADQPRPKDYIVDMTPVGGEKVGSWSGSASIDAANSVHFRNVPQGEYEVYGRPNPGKQTEATEKKRVVIKASKTTDINLKAK